MLSVIRVWKYGESCVKVNVLRLEVYSDQCKSSEIVVRDMVKVVIHEKCSECCDWYGNCHKSYEVWKIW